MGLNPRGRGRGGRGGKGSFPGKNRRGGGMLNQGPMFRPGPPGMFGPQMGFPPEPFGGPFFGGPSGYNYGTRAGFGKFPRKNFKRKPLPKNNDAPVPEIDLTKPWVTEEIKNEDAKKVELLEAWRKSKSDDDWNKYKSQKQVVQSLYDKAKEQYIETHPEEAVLWQNVEIRNYYCDTCDKSFRSDDDLLLHESEHETCGREGCEFTAHPKIIAKHIKMQHDSGLYKRIAKEDIEKWIEERKRRYPSRKVIEEKKKLEIEKKNRGERIEEDNSLFNKSFQKRSSSKMNKELKKKGQKNQKNQNRRIKNRKKINPIQKYISEEYPTVRAGVQAFGGIKSECESDLASKTNEESLEISDDEWDTFNNSKNFTKPLVNNSLGLLAANYDSDCDMLEDVKESISEQKLNLDENSPEEVKTVHVKIPLKDISENKEIVKRKINPSKKFIRKNNRSSNEHGNVSGKRKLTLLEKLLRKEIMHERNVILQCVHYIVKNNFFET